AGRITADAVLTPIRTEADFEKYRGKLKGKIVLTQPARAVRLLDDRIVLRMNENDIKESLTTPIPPARRPGGRGGGQASQADNPADSPADNPAGGQADFGGARALQQKIQKFLLEEGVAAVFERGS